MIDDMMGESWDLAEVLVERQQPKGSVAVFLNEELTYAKSLLMEAHSTAKPESVKTLDEQIAKVDEELKKHRYEIHFTALPRRMRDDIESKAMHKFPIKPNMLTGADDPINAQQRGDYQNLLLWHAHIENVINPAGANREVWTLEEMEKFYGQLQIPARNAVIQAINKLNDDTERFTVESKNPDF